MLTLSDTQCRFTQNVGVIGQHEKIFCGVCKKEMNRSIHHDYNGWASAMAKIKSDFELFVCPDEQEDWHKQVVGLRNEAKKTYSKTIEKMLLDEADDVLKKELPTKFTEPM
jgi:hypothetical protein